MGSEFNTQRIALGKGHGLESGTHVHHGIRLFYVIRVLVPASLFDEMAFQ